MSERTDHASIEAQGNEAIRGSHNHLQSQQVDAVANYDRKRREAIQAIDTQIANCPCGSTVDQAAVARVRASVDQDYRQRIADIERQVREKRSATENEFAEKVGQAKREISAAAGKQRNEYEANREDSREARCGSGEAAAASARCQRCLRLATCQKKGNFFSSDRDW